MAWQILDKQKTGLMIDAVKSAGLGSLFDPNTTEARLRNLPFFRTTNLYRLTNYATLPAFSLFYLGDGENYSYLGGDFDAIDFYNTAENLLLNEETILPYLDFYLIFVKLDVGEINILGERDQYGILDEFPQETVVTHNEDRNVFIIEIPLYFDGTIMTGTIEITGEGEVSIINTKMSMQTIQNKIDYDTTTDY